MLTKTVGCSISHTLELSQQHASLSLNQYVRLLHTKPEMLASLWDLPARSIIFESNLYETRNILIGRSTYLAFKSRYSFMWFLALDSDYPLIGVIKIFCDQTSCFWTLQSPSSQWSWSVFCKYEIVTQQHLAIRYFLSWPFLFPSLGEITADLPPNYQLRPCFCWQQPEDWVTWRGTWHCIQTMCRGKGQKNARP